MGSRRTPLGSNDSHPTKRGAERTIRKEESAQSSGATTVPAFRRGILRFRHLCVCTHRPPGPRGPHTLPPAPGKRRAPAAAAPRYLRPLPRSSLRHGASGTAALPRDAPPPAPAPALASPVQHFPDPLAHAVGRRGDAAPGATALGRQVLDGGHDMVGLRREVRRRRRLRRRRVPRVAVALRGEHRGGAAPQRRAESIPAGAAGAATAAASGQRRTLARSSLTELPCSEGRAAAAGECRSRSTERRQFGDPPPAAAAHTPSAQPLPPGRRAGPTPLFPPAAAPRAPALLCGPAAACGGARPRERCLSLAARGRRSTRLAAPTPPSGRSRPSARGGTGSAGLGPGPAGLGRCSAATSSPRKFPLAHS